MINKTARFAGIDVGAEELVLVVRKNATSMKPQKCANTPAEHARLVAKLAKLPGLRVCLEATGMYHLELAVALHRQTKHLEKRFVIH